MQSSRLYGTYCLKPLLYEACLAGSTGREFRIGLNSPREGGLRRSKLDLLRPAML
jgi:hypothetical protein